jgi:hypothetical protein
MAEQNQGLLNRLREIFSRRRAVTAAAFASTVTPTDVQKVPFLDTPPDGLGLVHVASTTAEAEMLGNVLTDAGFHVEFVPSIAMGVFGMAGNNRVYVRREEREECIAFIDEYLRAHEPAPEE